MGWKLFPLFNWIKGIKLVNVEWRKRFCRNFSQSCRIRFVLFFVFVRKGISINKSDFVSEMRAI